MSLLCKAWLGLRAVVYLLWLVVTVVPWALTVLVVSIFVRGAPVYWLCAGWLGVATWGAKVICGIRSRVIGLENLPDGPAVLAPKHQSTWETFAFPTIMPRPLSYVFKRELLYVPFFGWAMSRLDMVHIDRSRRAEAWAKVSAQGQRFMQQGNWVIMFPEGTRVRRGERGRYQGGASRLAVEAGVPVVPIAVTSARCWPKGGFIKQPGVIDVSIGPPIPSQGRKPADVLRDIETWIEAEMQRLDPEAYTARSATAEPAHAS